MNCWFDYGVDLGGNTLDLAIRMLGDATVSEALKHLEGTGLYSGHRSPALPVTRSAYRRPAKTTTEAKEENQPFELLSARPLEHPALLQYLDKRGINRELANRYLSQIDFKRPQSASRYFALGWPSGDGYEARNALFKGFVGTRKEITVLEHPESELLLVFEGFMDFLTYLTIKKLQEAQGTVIILNSGNMKARALPYLQDKRYSKIQLFLDNDAVGQSTFDLFSSTVESDRLEDMRLFYAGYSDLNEWHLKRNS